MEDEKELPVQQGKQMQSSSGLNSMASVTSESKTESVMKSANSQSSTCTRCLKVIDKNTECTISHPPHMLQDQGSMHGGINQWMFFCLACSGSFTKTSKEYTMSTAPITEGAKFCYKGPHTTKPLPDDDHRRFCNDTLLLYACSDIQEKINNIPTTMPHVKSLVIQSEGCYNESIKPSLAIAMPKLETLKLIDVAFSKITLDTKLTPLLEDLFMQNIPEECEITVQLPKLITFGMHYYGPVDNEKWFHDMLRTSQSLRDFDSYKLRIRGKINFAGNDLNSISLHRAECMTHLTVYAPNLTDLSLQACYGIQGVKFLDSHPKFTRPPGNGSKFTVNTTNACLNKSIVNTLQTNPRVMWSGEDDDDDPFSNPSESMFRDMHRFGSLFK
jgi:hypothetical protein